jgi:hypothetical protein
MAAPPFLQHSLRQVSWWLTRLTMPYSSGYLNAERSLIDKYGNRRKEPIYATNNHISWQKRAAERRHGRIPHTAIYPLFYIGTSILQNALAGF